MVEAAGVEPDPAGSCNRLMAHDFSFQPAENSLPCTRFRVDWSQLESTPVVERSWRRNSTP